MFCPPEFVFCSAGPSYFYSVRLNFIIARHSFSARHDFFCPANVFTWPASTRSRAWEHFTAGCKLASREHFRQVFCCTSNNLCSIPLQFFRYTRACMHVSIHVHTSPLTCTSLFKSMNRRMHQCMCTHPFYYNLLSIIMYT